MEGLVVDAHRSGRLKGRARLDLALESVNVNGTAYNIQHHFRSSSWRKTQEPEHCLIAGGVAAEVRSSAR